MQIYSEVLSNEEIYRIGLILKSFEYEGLDYKDFVSSMNAIGIDVSPITVDFSKKKMTVTAAEGVKSRIENEQFLPTDINYFLISSPNYSNVVLRYDISMIEVLADRGDLDSQKRLVSILEYQCRKIGMPTNKKQRESLQAWKSRIEQLNEQIHLQSNQKINK